MSNTTADILIVGAGPTGLTLACELLRRGVPCRIIDKNLVPTKHSKAIGVSSTSMMIFERLGFVKDFIDSAIKMEDTHFFWNKNNFLHINYRYLKNITKYPYMALIHQPETERYLTRCLEKLGGRIERGVALQELHQDSEQVDVVLVDQNGSQEEISYQYVIGCDGSRSKVRDLLNISFTGEDYGFHLIYGDFELENWNGDPTTAHYYNEDSNLLIIIPTPNNIYRVVGLIPGDKSVRPRPTLQDLEDYLNKFSSCDVKLKNPTQFGSVPLYYRIANTNQVGNVYLAGDAFHLFSPIGGQGMNSGIQDAYNLAWKLAYVKKGWSPKKLLDSYEEERLTLVKKLIDNLCKTINLLIRLDKENDETGIDLAPKFSNRFKFRHVFPKNYSGFNYKYNLSQFVVQDLPLVASKGVSAGQYCSDIEGLHELTNHKLIVYINYQEKIPLVEDLKNIIYEYSFIKLAVQEIVEDSYFCLIRPDGYIGYQGTSNNLEKFKDYLKRFYRIGY